MPSALRRPYNSRTVALSPDEWQSKTRGACLPSLSIPISVISQRCYQMRKATVCDGGAAPPPCVEACCGANCVVTSISVCFAFSVIPNPVAFCANGGEGSAFRSWALTMGRVYCVYILASCSRNLYTGVTDNLDRRMIEHRLGLVPGFTTRYRVFRLVHFERFANVNEAIDREKEIKAWRREKKIWLIKRHNPTWEDLAERLPHPYRKAGAKADQEDINSKADPSPPFAEKTRRPGSG